MKWVDAVACTVLIVIVTAVPASSARKPSSSCREGTTYKQAQYVQMPDRAPSHRSERERVASQIRDFLWTHWSSRKPACIVVTDSTIEATAVESSYFIATDAKGQWSIRVAREFVQHEFGSMGKQPKRSEVQFRAYIVTRVPFSTQEGTEVFRLVLKDKAGNEMSIE